MAPFGTLTNSCIVERLENKTEIHDGLESEERLYFLMQINYYLSDFHYATPLFSEIYFEVNKKTFPKKGLCKVRFKLFSPFGVVFKSTIIDRII